MTIFGSARVGPGTWIYDAVKDLARVLAEMGISIITGGGPGLMQAANEGASQAGPEALKNSMGIRVSLPFEQDANPAGRSESLADSDEDEPEDGPVERIDPGRRQPDPAEAKGEDRVLVVAGVVMDGPVGGEHGHVGLAGERIVERPQQVTDRLGRCPGVLQPARPDLRVGPAMDPSLALVTGSP